MNSFLCKGVGFFNGELVVVYIGFQSVCSSYLSRRTANNKRRLKHREEEEEGCDLFLLDTGISVLQGSFIEDVYCNNRYTCR